MPEWKQRTPKIDFVPAFTSITDQLGYINGIEDVETFLNPRASNQHDPYLMYNIEEASAKILSVVNAGGKIAVSCDPDSDGLSSSAMMYNYLLNLTPNIYMIYAERSDGHGIENQVDKIEPDTKLVIICDSSSGPSSIVTCKALWESEIDIVILDHHPVAVDEDGYINRYAIIVNPQHPDCSYPNKSLSGAGVVYKTIKVMNDSVGVDDDVVDDHCLPLVAVGLCADVMDVTNMENRYLISEGLKRLVTHPDANPGLTAILKINKVNTKSMNSQVIGFTIGPMLNGAARMGNIKLAIDLLTSTEPFECGTLAKQIKALNDERKVIEKTIFNGLLHMVDENDKVIVVYDDDIGKSFSGLVATKFTSAYKRPAVVFRRQGKYLSGSYRGIGDVNMREVLKGFVEQVREDIFNPAYGFVEGHEQAGGIGIDMADLGLLKKYLNAHFADTAFETAVEYDLVFDADDVTNELIREVERFNYITGQGLPQSKFLVRGLEIIKRAVMGGNKDTVKMTCSNEMALMKFRGDGTFGIEFEPKMVENAENPDAPKVPIFCKVDVVGSLNVNGYYNFGIKKYIETNQVFIEDIKAC